MNKPYTIFGETKSIPLKIWYDNKIDPTLTEWDETLWIEREEDWYSLLSSDLKYKRVRIIDRDVWIRTNTQSGVE